MTEKLEMQSMDKVQDNIEKIRKLFPNTVTEVIDGYVKDENGDEKPIIKLKVDFDVLKQELADTLIDERELRYQFTWPDKQKSILLANTSVAKTLRPDKEKSVDFDNTQNLYIEGDNLDVLKLLRETYLGKIKMIYIDPPYNTGNDFVYEDDFAIEGEEYKYGSGQYDEERNRLFQNTESNGRFHTDWLNMIYPRLKVAKDLLTDDGVIFISIDENEFINMGKLCNEIFGEKNFVECLVYDKKSAPKGVPTRNMIVGVHEYIYVYAKDYDKFQFLGIPRGKEGFSNPDNDERGIWRNTNIKSTVSEVAYTIRDPHTGFEFTDTWAFSPSEMEKLINEGRIIFPKDPTGQVRAKEYYNEFKNPNIPIKSSLGLYDAQKNTEMLTNLMEGKYFTNAKNLWLMKDLISYVSASKKDDIILDFFSGSATTAHAVLQLNAEDGGNRKFIMVQLPEPCDEKSEAYKAGYKTICEIGEERIRRAGKQIVEEKAHLTNAYKSGALQLEMAFAEFTNSDQAKETQEKIKKHLDIGFRVLRLDSSNMREVYYHPEKYTQTLLDALTDNIKEDRTPLDLLFQVMLDLGVKPSAKIEEKEIAGKRVYVVNENELIACFDNEITDEVVTAIAKRKPLYAAFRDSSHASDSVAANFEQIFATYSPKTTKEVL